MNRTEPTRMLIADDERGFLNALAAYLSRGNRDIRLANDGTEALALLDDGPPAEVVITDLMMPGVDGMGVLRHALQRSPGTLVIVMTGYGSITTAVAAIGQGAFDYKTKPFLLEEMGFSVRRAEAHLQLIRERDRLAGRVSDLERALAARSPGTQAGGGRAARQPRAPLEILEGQLSPREAFVSYRHWETAPPGAEGLAILEVLRRRGIISDDQHKLLHAQFSKGRAVVS